MTLEQWSSILKVKNKSTRITSGASTVNFEHSLHFILTVIIAEQINAVWVWEIIVSDKFPSNNCGKYKVLYRPVKFVGLHVFILIHPT